MTDKVSACPIDGDYRYIVLVIPIIQLSVFQCLPLIAEFRLNPSVKRAAFLLSTTTYVCQPCRQVCKLFPCRKPGIKHT